MRRRAILSFLAACALSACATQTTAPMRGLVGMNWVSLNIADEGPKLAYGTPDSDNVLIMLSCTPRSGMVAIDVSAPQGERAAVKLASGAEAARYRIEYGMGPSDEALLSATTRTSDPVLVRFAQTGELTLTVGKNSAALPARPSQVAGFLAGCR